MSSDPLGTGCPIVLINALRFVLVTYTNVLFLHKQVSVSKTVDLFCGADK